MSKSLTDLLAEVAGEVGYVQKDGHNSAMKYSYASHMAVCRKVNTALSARGIAVASKAELQVWDAEKGLAIVRLTLEFRRGQEMVQVQGLGQGSDRGDKAVMKANTAAHKYALTNAFSISWGDDPEGDESTDAVNHVIASSPKPRKAAKKEVPHVEGGEILQAFLSAKTKDEVNTLKEKYKKEVLDLRGTPIYNEIIKASKKEA